MVLRTARALRSPGTALPPALCAARARAPYAGPPAPAVRVHILAGSPHDCGVVERAGLPCPREPALVRFALLDSSFCVRSNDRLQYA